MPDPGLFELIICASIWITLSGGNDFTALINVTNLSCSLVTGGKTAIFNRDLDLLGSSDFLSCQATATANRKFDP
jgi:hypothetical protein